MKSERKAAPIVWRAFDRAIDETAIAFEGRADAAALRLLLDLVRQGVRRLVEQEEDARQLFRDAPPQLPVIRIIDHLRRTFVDRLATAAASAETVRDQSLAVGAPAPAEACDAIHVLSALGQVQSYFDRAAFADVLEPLDGREALGLAVEVAHDMRSPLSALLFLVDMLRSGRSGPVTALQAKQLGMVYTAALGLNEMACDLIDLVRGADRLVEQSATPFSILEVMHSVRDILQPIAEEQGLAIVLQAPEQDGRVGQSAALTRILLNLTSNAVKYASGGSIILAATARTADRVEFSVTDPGSAVPARVVPELFRPFRRTGQAGAYSFSSAGLGLSICHRLVSALGSELRVDTTPGTGTRFAFEISLPVAAES